LAVGLWPLFRAINATREFIDPSIPKETLSVGNVEIVTFDTAMALMVLVLAVMWCRGWQRRADPWSLTNVLVVSTLVAHAKTFIPPGLSNPIFYLALIFPIAYEYLFNAESLNSPTPARSIHVLRATSLAAALMTFVAVSVKVGQISPQRT